MLPGGMVEVYIIQPDQKRELRSIVLTVLDVDTEKGSIIVLGFRGRNVEAAFEDIQPAISDETFSQIVQEVRNVSARTIDSEHSEL